MQCCLSWLNHDGVKGGCDHEATMLSLRERQYNSRRLKHFALRPRIPMMIVWRQGLIRKQVSDGKAGHTNGQANIWHGRGLSSNDKEGVGLCVVEIADMVIRY